MRIFHGYRPRLPVLRAQTIQSIHTAHALAVRGHTVSVVADRVAGWSGEEKSALEVYGLSPHPGLALSVSTVAQPTVAGLRFRAMLAAWMLGGPGVLYARSKKWAKFATKLPGFSDVRLVLEVHEVDSLQLAERGEESAEMVALERSVLGAAVGVVANCEGTLEQLLLAHGDTVPLQRAVIHNATAPDRAVAPTPHQGLVVGYIGSPRRYKDVETLFAVARALSPEISVVVVGATEDDAAMAAHAQSMGVRVLNAVPYAEVPALLAGLDVAILPLGQDLYSRELASPLKLWDYLAAGLRVVAADTPAIRRFPGEAITTYRPGSVQSMAEAIQTALERPRPTPLVRTWDDRAAEIEDFLEALA